VVSGAVAVLALVIATGVVSVVLRGGFHTLLASFRVSQLPIAFLPGLPALPGPLQASVTLLTAVGYCLFALGGVETLAHIAPELQQPRIRQLRRIVLLVCFYSLFVTAAVGFLVAAIVPPDARSLDAPLAALTLYLRAPVWFRSSLLLGTVMAATLLLTAAAHRAAFGAQRVLLRLSEDGVLTSSLRALHSRFGTPWRLIDITITGQLGVVFMSAGRVSWLARAYAVGLVWSALLKIGALVRFRILQPGPRAFRFPLNVRVGGREWPVGLLLVASLLGAAATLILATGDPASLGGAGLLLALVIFLTVSERSIAADTAAEPTPFDEVDLLPAADVNLSHVEARPDSLLVSVRNPHFLAHLTAALRAASDRDVVVMTARLIGVDDPDDLASRPQATEEERRLFSAVVAVAERHGRAVGLLIVPAINVFDAVVETALRLRSSEVYVGESETLSADDQARLLGEAWERAPKPEREPLDLRLVIHHRSGRTAAYHLGAHAPTLSADDLRLIHGLWLDVAKALGPSVHHHDVVRAALKHMEQQLNGPTRDAALDLVRQVARPADELAAVVRARDFARLRDMVRNRPPSDLADLLTALTLEDQVVVFRILPRKVAAATFEYLSREAQEALLKAMAQEDVAALLNNMAPDDRTMFLEELPASATRQLLALLTPQERSVAMTLLGYPEGSIGRLMTPDYIAVREDWTVQYVLEYIREHGHDSETLNVIYIVDDHGLLLDDIRIREFLLTSPANKVSDLMDRRFVALKAADDQETAVAVFRAQDRSALPVTDSAGVLIGIVTVDDVLDVAEAAATKDIQQVGGSEALDEPYIRIAFGRMIQKRAGWLTALFLGEMLTATAMGAFQREIERAVVLALFVPLIISSGGNSGSQASTLVIRAIALGEVQLKDWWRVMRREVAAGLALGSILAAIGFVRITLWSAFSDIYGPHWLLVALTVAIALVGVVLWGTLVGSLLPFLLRRLGFDPAVSSAPFVATLVDVTGLVIYFTVGLVILRGTLL
jgi:magnesium transporter